MHQPLQWLFICHRDYGYAAARAYTAYQDPDFLDLVVTSWLILVDSNSGRRHLLENRLRQAKSRQPSLCLLPYPFGSISRSNVSPDISRCRNRLGKCYTVNPSNIVLDPVSSLSNESCSVDSTVYSYNSGIFIEGLVVLADITRNVSTEVLRSTIVTVATDTLWQGLDGIIITTTVGGHYIVPALAALYERNTTSSDLREYIKEYIGVQYNTILQQATSNGSNIYGLPWKAPPSTSFSSDNQTTAHRVVIPSRVLPLPQARQHHQQRRA